MGARGLAEFSGGLKAHLGDDCSGAHIAVLAVSMNTGDAEIPAPVAIELGADYARLPRYVRFGSEPDGANALIGFLIVASAPDAIRVEVSSPCRSKESP